jgi:CheY-like chemotaxis protein/HPt (histidine-containing phosphotransfer) domain-containing protein
MTTQPVRPEPSSPGAARVLVAEDDPINRKLIQTQLQVLGYSCALAEDGAQALELWRRGRFEVLLTDLHMPRLDGPGLVSAIRSECRARGRSPLPIVLFTGQTPDRALAGGPDRAVDGYLVKPVGLAALRTELARWLQPPQPAESTGPLLRPERLHELLGGDVDAVRAVMAEFVPAAGRMAEELVTALRNGDLQHAGALAHKLTSAARSVGADPLADFCAALQAGRGAAGELEGELGLEAFERLVQGTLRAAEASLEARS